MIGKVCKLCLINPCAHLLQTELSSFAHSLPPWSLLSPCTWIASEHRRPQANSPLDIENKHLVSVGPLMDLKKAFSHCQNEPSSMQRHADTISLLSALLCKYMYTCSMASFKGGLLYTIESLGSLVDAVGMKRIEKSQFELIDVG